MLNSYSPMWRYYEVGSLGGSTTLQLCFCPDMIWGTSQMESPDKQLSPHSNCSTVSSSLTSPYKPPSINYKALVDVIALFLAYFYSLGNLPQSLFPFTYRVWHKFPITFGANVARSWWLFFFFNLRVSELSSVQPIYIYFNLCYVRTHYVILFYIFYLLYFIFDILSSTQ